MDFREWHADALRHQGGPRHAFWQARLCEAPHTRSRLRAFELEGVPRVVAAAGARLDRVSGRGWLAVGDAAMSLDPLSSQGLTQALASGIRAGEAVNRRLAGDTGALGEYDRGADDAFRRYARQHASYYARERRWPHSVFWRRRHAAAA